MFFFPSYFFNSNHRIWYKSTENLKPAIDAYFAANPNETDKEFYFLLNLDNPVGFDSNGYNSNGSTLNQNFNSLNQGFDMNANISPLEISQIVISFGS